MNITKNSKKIILLLILKLVAGYSCTVYSQTEKTSPPKLNSDNTSSSQDIDLNRHSHEIHRHSLGIGIGETFLLGNFRHHGNDSITFDTYYNYSASYSFDLLVNAHYSKHEYKSREVTIPGVAVGIKAKLYHFDSFAPFVLAGVGFYRPKMKRYLNPAETILVKTESKTAFGFNIGVGADLKLNNMVSVGFIGHYHNPFDLKQTVGPDVEGSYFKLLLTIMYYL